MFLALSGYLSNLKRAGPVRERKEGQRRIYAINLPIFQEAFYVVAPVFDPAAGVLVKLSRLVDGWTAKPRGVWTMPWFCPPCTAKIMVSVKRISGHGLLGERLLRPAGTPVSLCVRG
jgi:hypothetical protein